ncbi:MAG: hypothetical protein IJ960_00825 [Oscillospiraceae bacterium]|nr:hypothetical protein [Oscillospiraceae bacterium]
MPSLIPFPSHHITLAEACMIVRDRMEDDSIPIPTKVLAIEMVARMETHNSIRKDDLVAALRWLFDHYDF